jgi:PEP-CTERM motif
MRSDLCAPQDGLKKNIQKRRRCMKRRSFISIVLALSIGFISVNAEASMTIATFADPSGDSGNPLFTVDFSGGTLNGEWADGKTGLTLEMPYSGYTIGSGNAFHDVWFEMDEVIIHPLGDTTGGEINLYAHGTTIPLLTIDFESGYVDRGNFGADEFFGDNVTISGIGITPGTLSEEEFSFAFANKMDLPGSDDGFTATASFNSSAVPEPATVCLLGLGALSLIRRKE